MRRFAAVVLVLAGIGFFAWQYVGTNVVASHSQNVARHAIAENFKAGDTTKSQSTVTTKINVGSKSIAGVGLLSIPVIGVKDVPVVDSFTQAALDDGLVGSMGVKPGEVGNTALIGHVVTRGEPFENLADLRKGDTVKIETSDGTFTYKIRSAPVTVKDTDIWPMLPVPDPQAIGGEKVKPVLTLITCASPFFRTEKRIVVVGDLVKGTP